MFNTIWQLLIKNWKTSATGLVTFLVWLVKTVFQIEVPQEIQVSFLAFMVSLGLLFSKDGNVSGDGK